MKRASVLILLFLLTATVHAATYYECLVMVGGTNGGYASLVTPDKATPPTPSAYYYANRPDLPWGPSTVNYVTNSVTNVMAAWWTFETNTYPQLGISTQANFSPCTNLWGQYQNNIINNGPVWSNAVGGSMWFDGVDDYYDSGARYGLYFGVDRDVSISAWVYPQRVNHATAIDFFLGGEGSPIYVGASYMYAGFAQNTISFQYRATAGAATDLTIPLVAGFASNWHHVVFIKRTSTDKVEIWTNAALAGTIADSSTAYMNGNSHFTLGAVEMNPGTHYPYLGGIGPVAVSSNETAWTGLQITNLYNDSCTKYGKSKLYDPPAPPPVGYNYAYRPDLPSGPYTNSLVTTSLWTNAWQWLAVGSNTYPVTGVTNEVDFGNVGRFGTNDMTISGMTWTNLPSVGWAMWYDGIDDYLTSPAGTNIYPSLSNDFSISGWYWFGTVSSANSIPWGFGPVGASGYMYMTIASKNLMWYWRPVNPGPTGYAEAAVNDGFASNWVHIVALRRAATDYFEIWTNAVLGQAANRIVTNNASVPATVTWTVGAYDSGATMQYHFKGMIKELLPATNYAPNGTEITNMFNVTCGKYGLSQK